jgi:hypothetical protein
MLMRMPPEIIHEIFQNLAAPTDYNDFDREPDDVISGERALVSLTRTCKRLRHQALPLLYRVFSTGWPSTEGPSTEQPITGSFQLRYLLLVRTLVENPAFAHHIRCIVLAEDASGWVASEPCNSHRIAAEELCSAYRKRIDEEENALVHRVPAILAAMMVEGLVEVDRLAGSCSFPSCT